jgi:hypothetical protein
MKICGHTIIDPGRLYRRFRPHAFGDTVRTSLEILDHERIPYECFIPKAGGVKIDGLGRAAQKLQAAREKAAQVKWRKAAFRTSVASFKVKDSFNRVPSSARLSS